MTSFKRKMLLCAHMHMLYLLIIFHKIFWVKRIQGSCCWGNWNDGVIVWESVKCRINTTELNLITLWNIRPSLNQYLIFSAILQISCSHYISREYQPPHRGSAYPSTILQDLLVDRWQNILSEFVTSASLNISFFSSPMLYCIWFYPLKLSDTFDILQLLFLKLDQT